MLVTALARIDFYLFKATCVRVKIKQDHYGLQSNWEKVPFKHLYIRKNKYKNKYQNIYYNFYFFYWAYLIFLKKSLHISWSKDRERSYFCNPSGAQTQMMTHMKREPCASLFRKNHFRNYQSSQSSINYHHHHHHHHHQSIISQQLLYSIRLIWI